MASGRPTVEPQNFVLLDGLRGLGATLVLVGHILLVLGPVVVPGGAVIVDLFFLLSGFVIAYSYEPRFATGMRASEFMLQRIVRLYPLYLLGIVIGYGLLLLAAIGDADGAQRSLTLTLQFIPEVFVLPAPQALGNSDAYPLNVPAWTLFFEFLVNLVYVLAFRWLRDTRVLVVVTLLCAMVLIVTVLTLGGIDAGSRWSDFWAGFGRAGFGFFAGVLTYRLLGKPTTSRRPVSWWALVVLVAIPVACFWPATPELRPFVDLTMAVGLGMPLLYISQAIEPPKRFVRLFIMGGRVSYAIYILHWPFLEAARHMIWSRPNLAEMGPAIGAVIFLIVLPFAYFAEGWFDRPVRRWIVAKLKRRAAKVERPAAEQKPGPAFAE
jgi:peptidoglycan/LPS O-acetylase OafA/YrhL